MSSVKLNVFEVVESDEVEGLGLSGSRALGGAINRRLRSKNTMNIATLPTIPPQTTPMMIFAGLESMSAYDFDDGNVVELTQTTLLYLPCSDSLQ